MPDNVQLHPIAAIHIGLFSNGNIGAKCEGIQSRGQLNMLIETAKQDLVRQFEKLEAEQSEKGVLIPPPGLKAG